MAKIFLACVGVAYIALAFWCGFLPGSTSKAIGFELKPGSGQSEYFVVYGGLQLALGIAFLWPLCRSQDLPLCLGLCLLIHASLVLFRSISFLLYREIGITTYALAGVEWGILLLSAWFWWSLPSTH